HQPFARRALVHRHAPRRRSGGGWRVLLRLLPRGGLLVGHEELRALRRQAPLAGLRARCRMTLASIGELLARPEPAPGSLDGWGEERLGQEVELEVGAQVHQQERLAVRAGTANDERAVAERRAVDRRLLLATQREAVTAQTQQVAVERQPLAVRR